MLLSIITVAKRDIAFACNSTSDWFVPSLWQYLWDPFLEPIKSLAQRNECAMVCVALQELTVVCNVYGNIRRKIAAGYQI